MWSAVRTCSQWSWHSSGVDSDCLGACRTILAAILWTCSSFWMLLAGARAREHCSSREVRGWDCKPVSAPITTSAATTYYYHANNNSKKEAVFRWWFTWSVPAWRCREWNVLPGESEWSTSSDCWCCCMSAGRRHRCTHCTWSVFSVTSCFFQLKKYDDTSRPV